MKHHFHCSEGIGTGAGTGVAIPLGIGASDVLLAVWTHATGVAPVGRDVSAFTVSAGSIQSASVSTSGLKVYAIWYSV